MEVFFGCVGGRIREAIPTRVGPLPPQVLCYFWFNCPQWSILPTVLSFEVRQGKAILKIAGNLNDRQWEGWESATGRQAYLGDFSPPKNLFGDLIFLVRWILSSDHR